MSDPTSEPATAKLSSKIDDVIVGLKWMACLLLLTISIANFYFSLNIGGFERLFKDMLPGKPLPILTYAVFYLKMPLQILALIWPVIGISIIFCAKKVKFWTVISSIVAFFIGLQLILTWEGCIAPFFVVIEALDDDHR